MTFSQIVDKLVKASSLGPTIGDVITFTNDIVTDCLPIDHFSNTAGVTIDTTISPVAKSEGTVTMDLPKDFGTLISVVTGNKVPLKTRHTGRDFLTKHHSVAVTGRRMFIRTDPMEYLFYIDYRKRPKVFTYRPANKRLVTCVDQTLLYRATLDMEFAPLDYNDPIQDALATNNSNVVLMDYPGVVEAGVSSKVASRYGDLSVGARLFNEYTAAKENMLNRLAADHTNNTL